jgi:dTDP-4-dehydrorhamnose 3,5-epimerase
VLENDTEVLYKATAPYHRDSERTIAWNDPDLASAWPVEASSIRSDRDAVARPLGKSEVFA